MNRVKIYNLNGKSSRTIALPKVFEAEFRSDIIHRAVIAQQSNRFQPQGRDPMAGKKTTAESYGVGRGLSRMPRVKGERYRKAGQGAFAPGTVGGRLAHPPRVEKILTKKINRKERRLALKSAIAATANKDLVSSRGHIFNLKRGLPIIVSDKIEELNKTKEALEVLENLKVGDDIQRVKESVKERAGKGKMRGRRLKHAIGPLIIVNKDQGVSKATRNILGVDVAKVSHLSVENLAPGTHPCRLTIWSESALKAVDNMFNERVKTTA